MVVVIVKEKEKLVSPKRGIPEKGGVKFELVNLANELVLKNEICVSLKKFVLRLFPNYFLHLLRYEGVIILRLHFQRFSTKRALFALLAHYLLRALNT